MSDLEQAFENEIIEKKSHAQGETTDKSENEQHEQESREWTSWMVFKQRGPSSSMVAPDEVLQVVQTVSQKKWKPKKGVIAENKKVKVVKAEFYPWKTWFRSSGDNYFRYIFGKDSPNEANSYLYVYVKNGKFRLRSGSEPDENTKDETDDRVFQYTNDPSSPNADLLLHLASMNASSNCYTGVATAGDNVELVIKQLAQSWSFE